MISLRTLRDQDKAMLCAPSQANLIGLFPVLSCNLKHISILHDPLIVSAKRGIGCDDNPVFLADTDGLLVHVHGTYLNLVNSWDDSMVKEFFDMVGREIGDANSLHKAL